MRQSERVLLRDIRHGVFAYLAWVPDAGYEWRSDLQPCSQPRPKRVSEETTKTGLPRWVDRGPTPDPPPYLVGPAPVGVPELSHPRGVLREGQYRDDGLHPGLHRRFAGLAGPGRMKAFADRYGELVGHPDRGGMELSSGVGGAVWYGESLALWQRETAAMTALIAAWAEHKSTVVREEVNERLHQHVNPVLLPRGVGGGYRIIFAADCLLSALYVLFALEVAAATDEKLEPPKVCENPRCPRGGEPFTPVRRDQVYCSSNCRSNASYHRLKGSKEEA